jgi:ketosteroid isomerase-like protein
MRAKWTLSTLTVITSFCFLSVAYGQDIEALKVSFTAEIAALSAKNLDGAVAEAHDDIVLFGVFSPFPIVGKEAFRQAVQEYFAEIGQPTFTPSDSEFGIIGNTGVVWGSYQMTMQQPGDSPTSSQGRYIFTYAQADGKWKLLSMHISPLPE